jgi:hypothetical protein
MILPLFAAAASLAVANTGDGSLSGQHRNDGMLCLYELQEGFSWSIGEIPGAATLHHVCSPAGHFLYICMLQVVDMQHHRHHACLPNMLEGVQQWIQVCFQCLPVVL